ILAAIDAEQREAAFEDEAARTRSDADRLDEALSAWVGRRVALSGRSADLRARIYRSIAFAIDDVLAHRGGSPEYAYDVIETDLLFNLACRRALLRLLHAQHARVVIYQAPQRTDLPPMADPLREEQVMGELLAEARADGAVTLDARHVVPNDQWGWERETPDRSHFRPPGHELLGRFLAEGIARAGVWRTLEGNDAR